VECASQTQFTLSSQQGLDALDGCVKVDEYLLLSSEHLIC